MATSGSSDFNQTRNEIIHQAARKIKAVDSGGVMDASAVTDFTAALNAMVKLWAKTDIRVWTVTEATLFPVVSQARYALGGSTTDNCTNTHDYQTTTLSAAEASGQTVLSVASVVDVAVSDKIGIVLDDGTIQWTTVASVQATTITVDTALTDSAAFGNHVFSYTKDITRPLKIVAIRRYRYSSGASVPIILMPRLDYQDLTSKEDDGIVNSAFYDAQLSSGQLSLWYRPEDVDELIRFTYHRPIEDFDAAGDDPDLPQEWILPLVFNLAVIMAPEYDVPQSQYNTIVSQAAAYLDAVMGADHDEGSIFFQPDMSDYR